MNDDFNQNCVKKCKTPENLLTVKKNCLIHSNTLLSAYLCHKKMMRNECFRYTAKRFNQKHH